ncbi:hypothetical protein HMN09_01065900 [Mycena chlorophos]|uniref:Acid protease n=1 Tax=Mycena chlorophos TaxID=658473 RepID=A0A8H6SBP8_MYCCL|nr:hypothetical protein HMN09_01065900 [Mycena chlorophos]
MKWLLVPLTFLVAGALVSAEQPTKRVAGQVSNAERLARGLPLRPPHRRSSALQPRSSNSAPITATKSCMLAAFNAADNSFYGFLQAEYGPQTPSDPGYLGTYGLFTGDSSSALGVSFTYTYDPSSSSTVVGGLQVRTTNAPGQSTYGYLGIADPVAFGGGPISASSPANYGFLTDVPHAANSPTTVTPNAFSTLMNLAMTTDLFSSPVESYVWSYDVSSGELAPSWTVAEGTTIPLQVGIQFGMNNVTATWQQFLGSSGSWTQLYFKCTQVEIE